ncbi:hypothetical protein [Streptomyces sp. SID10815]|uniref:hypothetical protein n=1 Tax=Streptomyces sp. SID10815 TaxID=2706027 RepID=UPI0013C577F1|nr:hypothetical protein [Streptomyces sp. SID10815]NEA52339.1 hypothetical protein [Streptomyces sp. SID10815]
MTSPDLERLATLVQQRRTELRLGVEPAAKLGAISKDTWKRVEAGKRVWDRSYAAIDTTLQWAVGSCLRVLAGKDPLPTDRVDSGLQVTEVPKSDLEQAVGGAVQRAAIGTKGSLTGDEILELNRRVLDELRKLGII